MIGAVCHYKSLIEGLNVCKLLLSFVISKPLNTIFKILNMELKTAIEILEYHQEWRLGKREEMIHEPKKLTEALDVVLLELKKKSSTFYCKNRVFVENYHGKHCVFQCSECAQLVAVAKD